MLSGSQPTTSYPGLDLSGTDLALEFFADRPRLADQCGRLNAPALVGYISECREDFPVQAAMMFLGTFFEFPVQVCWNVFQRDRRQLRNRNGSILVVHLARRGMRGKSRLFFRNAFHLPKVDRPSYFQTPVTLAKAQRNENEVAGTMPDESLTARISGGQAAVNLPTR